MISCGGCVPDYFRPYVTVNYYSCSYRAVDETGFLSSGSVYVLSD